MYGYWDWIVKKRVERIPISYNFRKTEYEHSGLTCMVLCCSFFTYITSFGDTNSSVFPRIEIQMLLNGEHQILTRPPCLDLVNVDSASCFLFL